MRDRIEKLKETGGELSGEIRERTVAYVVAAFGLVAGLAWNEAIKAAIEYLFPLSKNTLLAKFIYAALITLMVVIVTVNLMKLSKKGDK